jgi:hypothetical protein
MNRHSHCTWINKLGLTTLLVFLVGVFSGYAIEFETSGRLVIENFKQSGGRMGRFSGSFVVQCSRNKWAINYLPDGIATSEQTMYDGFDIYGITRNIVLDKQAVNQFPEPDKYVRYSNGVAYARANTATIFSGEFPNGASFPQRFLWLVFLPGKNLSQSKTPQPPAPWLGSYMPEARCFEWKMRWPEMTSTFPQAVDFVVSTQLWANTVRDSETPKSTPQPITLPDGFVAARYNVVAWSPPRESDISLPADFRLDRYYSLGSAASRKILETYHGETTNFHYGSIEIERPPIGADVNVLDYRFDWWNRRWRWNPS